MGSTSFDVRHDGCDQSDENNEGINFAMVNYLTNFVSKMMNAPLKQKGNKQIPIVDVNVTLSEIRTISLFASNHLLHEQKSLIRIGSQILPIHIVGDIHGQFHDVRLILARCGHPSTSSYLFLGDYVDRGMQGLETAMFLLALRCLYPENVFLLRGNHEDYNTSMTYGFYDECVLKYGKNGEMVWLHLINTFNHLPLAGLIIDKVLCLHGGLSPNMNSIDEIENIARPSFVPSYGLACDLVWSDPEASQNNGFALSSRGISFSFDDTTIERFCLRNNIDLIIRAHQISSDMYRGGYKFHCNGRMITIFSAPNYLNMGNDSCVVRIDEKNMLKFLSLRPEKIYPKK